MPHLSVRLNVPHRQHTPAPVRQSKHGQRFCCMETLDGAELSHVKLLGEFASHDAQGQKRGQQLAQQEAQIERVNSPLQRKNDGVFISDEEEEDRQLEEERDQPKSSQLWNLKKTLISLYNKH